MTYDLGREIREAIMAGENALHSLREAQKYLNSAGNWGLVDVLGGNLVSGLMKHSKMNHAQQSIEWAKRDLRRFQKELDDVDEYLPDIQIGDFLTFADFFFDGFLADVFVQSKIGKAKKEVAEAIRRVESIVNRLRREV